MAWMTVAQVADVAEGKSTQLDVNGKKIALFHLADGWFAVSALCPHRGAELAQGAVQGKELLCPLHGARFDLATGKHLSPPARTDLACYPLQIQGNEVQIDL